MTNAYIITVDIGTSSTKTGLWRTDGALLAQTSANYPLQRRHPSWAEMDALDWWRATCNTVREVLASSGVAPREVAGIGVDGLGWTLLAVDEPGNPLAPATIWLDRRSDEEAAWLRSLPGADHLVELVANPLDAAYITPKLLWMKRHQPAIFAAADKFLTSSGYVVRMLTGQSTCDYTQAYGYHFFDIRGERWDEHAAQQIGIDLRKMPQLYPSHAVVGAVTAEAARMTGLHPGTPVIAGALDAAAGALGAGVVRLGQCVDQGGQAGGMALAVDRVMCEPRLIFSHHAIPGQYLLQSGTVGGGTPAWFRDVLGQPEVDAAALMGINPFELMTAQAERVPPGAHGLVFLPYMAGERTPLWSSAARGVFFGLSYRSSRGDMLRAILEGCAFAVYHNLKIAEGMGVNVSEWIGVGGGTRSALWCQIKADISNRPFVLARRSDGGEGGHSLGLLALVEHGIGLCDDMPAFVESLLPARTVFEPSPARHSMYEDLFGVYLRVSERMQEEFGHLAQVVATHERYLSPDAIP